MKNILKIGFLDLPENRWIDALSFFDKVYNIVLYENEKNMLNESRIVSYPLIDSDSSFIKRRINSYLIQLLLYRKGLTRFVFFFCVILFRFINNSNIKKILYNLNYSFCHSSYNDYDNSDIITVILKPYINSMIIRCQKETRPEFSRKERECFAASDVVVFNSKYNLYFFQKKYGKKLFCKKKIILNVDEDWRKHDNWVYPYGFKKISDYDNKHHIVILTGVARSTPNDKRSGPRQFYIKLIKYLLSCGFHVHLHALRFESDEYGIDLYKKLSHENIRFKIHPSLDFVNDTHNAYTRLASYDFGILHNFIEGQSVSQFDKYNIPHRFYEYQIARVIPVVIRNQTIVVENLIHSSNCGLVVDDYSDINKSSMIKNINFIKSSFLDFINSIYASNDHHN